LRDLVVGQSRLLDQVSKNIASNDKLLETINNRMDSFASAIKNQHNFNKMIESQIAHLASSIPPADKGKISWQPKELETANLIDIFNAGWY
jgi:septal ring factor EnvC (AmiA/AmiB activator)